MEDKTAGRVELARRVRAARARLYGTVEVARAAAKVSRGAWDNVESGGKAQDYILGRIERALGWPEGFALAIIDGTAPDLPPAVVSLREYVTEDANLSPEARAAILAIIDADHDGGETDDGPEAAPIVGL